MDNIVDFYERQVYSSGDLFAQIGGIFFFLKVIGAVLVFIFSERLLVAALASKLYQVYDENKSEDAGYNSRNDEAAPLNVSMCNSKLNVSSNKIQNLNVENDEENRFYSTNPIRNLFKNTLYCK